MLEPIIQKQKAVLIDDLFNTPTTSLLTFLFEPHLFASSQERLTKTSVSYASIEGKDLYLLDGFFTPEEGDEMRKFSKNTSFSRNSYGSSEAIAKGQKPARSMNGKERWQFFANPPKAIKEVYKFFAMLGARLGGEVTTLPWELCDASSHGSPAVIANKLEEASEESMGFGKHQDCSPEKRISFGIPVLYRDGELHGSQFVNGAPGKPWLISVMVYVAEEGFLPDYRMGTVFYQKDGTIAVRADCTHMRMVLFEGDVFHSMEESKIPMDVKMWRVSYVFKMIVNPKSEGKSMKTAFLEMIRDRPGMPNGI